MLCPSCLPLHCLWFCALNKHLCCRHFGSGQEGLSSSPTSYQDPAQVRGQLPPKMVSCSV